MNTARCMLLSLSIAGLSGCATSSPVVRAPAAEPRPGEVRITHDSGYIAQVERYARRRGIDVQWVHPPTRRVVTD